MSNPHLDHSRATSGNSTHEVDSRALAAQKPANPAEALLVLAFFLFRLWYASLRQLVPDETVYWTWSRHLAAGYLDHPPMVAWLIRFSTLLCHSTELGVRMPAILCATGTLAILLYIGRLLNFTPPEKYWLLAIWMTSPLLALYGTLMTPDTPVVFFSICALAVIIAIAKRNSSNSGLPAKSRELLQWLLFGILCGLALLSKYTAILLPAGVFLALLSHADGRKLLRDPWIYLSAIPALIVFSPVLFWNQQHQWASFRFQLHHGLDSNPPGILRGLGQYIGGQAMVWTPVLFILTLVVLIMSWRSAFSRPRPEAPAPPDLPKRLLLFSATLPLLFFAYAASRANGQPNWPGFAYLPASLLLIFWLRKPASSVLFNDRHVFLIIGCCVAFAGLVIVQYPELLWENDLSSTQAKALKKFDQMIGWREMGKWATLSARGLPVVATRAQDAGELAFYMTGQPDVWVVSPHDSPSAFDYFDNPPDFAAIPRVAYFGYSDHAREFAGQHHYNIVEESDWTFRRPDGTTHSAHLLILAR